LIARVIMFGFIIVAVALGGCQSRRWTARGDSYRTGGYGVETVVGTMRTGGWAAGEIEDYGDGWDGVGMDVYKVLIDMALTKNDALLKKTYEGLRARGMLPVQAAGVAANLYAESGLDARNVNSIGATGLQQWLGSRLTKMKDVLGERWDDFDAQLDYLVDEHRGNIEGYGWNYRGGSGKYNAKSGYYNFSKGEFDAAATPEEAAMMWNQGFGRPGRYEMRNEDRASLARRIYDTYGDGKSRGSRRAPYNYDTSFFADARYVSGSGRAAGRTGYMAAGDEDEDEDIEEWLKRMMGGSWEWAMADGMGYGESGDDLNIVDNEDELDGGMGRTGYLTQAGAEPPDADPTGLMSKIAGIAQRERERQLRLAKEDAEKRKSIAAGLLGVMGQKPYFGLRG
jgi:hypothetical protein